MLVTNWMFPLWKNSNPKRLRQVELFAADCISRIAQKNLESEEEISDAAQLVFPDSFAHWSIEKNKQRLQLPLAVAVHIFLGKRDDIEQTIDLEVNRKANIFILTS